MREDRRRSQAIAKVLRKRLTEAETILWSKLKARRNGRIFRRQHPIGPYIADFASIEDKLVIELDGDRHGSEQIHARDRRRDAYMTSRGWHVLRIPNGRIYTDLSGVLNMLETRTTSS